jgi:hypothetical protein
MAEASVLARLEADGLVRPGPDGARTTFRWQAAMARAAVRLYRSDALWQDLRLPIAVALLETCEGLADDELADLVEAAADRAARAARRGARIVRILILRRGLRMLQTGEAVRRYGNGHGAGTRTAPKGADHTGRGDLRISEVRP